jgi:hypothetical protein
MPLQTEERIGEIIDRSDIIEICCRMHWYVDRKLWHRLDEIFADEVSLPTRAEFQALRPGEATHGSSRPRSELIANMEQMMDGLTTQHNVAGHHVDLHGDTATCYANGTNMHIGPPSIAENRVVHANVYEFELTRTPVGWRITALNSQPIWAQGNESVAADRSRQVES